MPLYRVRTDDTGEWDRDHFVEAESIGAAIEVVQEWVAYHDPDGTDHPDPNFETFAAYQFTHVELITEDPIMRKRRA